MKIFVQPKGVFIIAQTKENIIFTLYMTHIIISRPTNEHEKEKKLSYPDAANIHVGHGGGGASPRSCFLRLERVGAGKICYFYIEVGIFSL